MLKSSLPNTCLAPLDLKIWGYFFCSLVSTRKTIRKLMSPNGRQFALHLPFLFLRPACYLLTYPIVLRLQLHGLSFEMWLWNKQLPSDAPWKHGWQVTAILSTIRRLKKEGEKPDRLSIGFHLYSLLFCSCHWFDSKVKFVRRSRVLVSHLD